MDPKHWLSLVVFSIGATRSLSAQADFYVGVEMGFADISAFANGAQRSLYLPPPVPATIPIDGARFEDSDAAAGLTVGYVFREWLAFEFGYQDLGTFGTAGEGLPSFSTSDLGAARITIDQVRFGAIFALPLSDRVSLNAYAGMSSVGFSASGGLGGFTHIGGGVRLRAERAAFPGVSPVLESDGLITSPGPNEPLSFIFQEFPFASPARETGWALGGGATFQLTERLDLDLRYRHEDLGLLEADSVAVGLKFALSSAE